MPKACGETCMHKTKVDDQEGQVRIMQAWWWLGGVKDVASTQGVVHSTWASMCGQHMGGLT